ncbi:LysE family translocator [Halobacillus salinarum]|uniref:LysE family translocator n=1 Tax=Halobacillus salinarum TaxID=2932257 RepID=A0ABY4EJY3_9BACI|nr:LysE family translocator [Halobacillus salinarum]UOQ43934.1 LysE family translocator [Halobacillus salinarum]
MNIALTLSFLGAAIILTVMPGPDNLFVIAQSIAQQKKAGIATSLGLCSGLIVHITAAALGISAAVYHSVLIFNLVKAAGAVYLLYLAWQSFRSQQSSFELNGAKQASYSALYKKGILMNLLNPKVSLFFLALLPQFVDRNLGHVPVQMLLLGVLFLIQAFVIFSAISIFSEKLKKWLDKKSNIGRKINMIQGSIFLLIGLKLLLSEK